ncbi:MAG: RT0821/Lpp0805 family surface protein [Alphaproteobacteria bacterium]
MVKKIVAFAVAALVLAGCENTTGMGTKQTGGTLVGAGLGALAGSQIGSGGGKLAAVAIGTLVGGFLGNEVGKSLDNADRAAANQAYGQAQAAPVGQTVAWNNPNSGNSGTITPVRDGTDTRTGAYCREFRQTVTVDGRTEDAYGTACRQPDGSWKIVQ